MEPLPAPTNLPFSRYRKSHKFGLFNQIVTPLEKSHPPEKISGSASVSNALLKSLCLMLNNRLKKYCAKNNLIATEQIGFKEKCRTSDHIFALRTLITKHLHTKKGIKFLHVLLICVKPMTLSTRKPFSTN